MNRKKEVLLIFKTHLDVGFTDYAENIVNKYLSEYIPNAIRVGYELKDTCTPFRWVVGSWLIDRALQNDTTGRVEQAVRDGILSWHALPFTTHTEAMNERLFEYGIGISRELDKRFHKSTVGAKMTDVPGHTIGMVAPYGRRLLQYGLAPRKQDLYFNLYNNIWNTNFPMWYEDDAAFRFTLIPAGER